MTAAPPVLRPREERGVTARLARSAAHRAAGTALRTDAFLPWLRRRSQAHRFAVRPLRLDRLEGWDFEEGTGNLRHRSGRFFTVEGLDVTVSDSDSGSDGPVRHWQQPVIKQPEVGILGLLCKEFDGVPHFLMQAKMEPGNPNLLQLSPTVQATRSNYTKVHRGADVKYIDYFVRPGRSRVLADTLQSEHGSWFHHKSNRNMIVETDEDVPVDGDYCWLTLGQIGELLHHDLTVNMDARTVLACAPVAPSASGTAGPGGALLRDTELLSWFTAERSRRGLRAVRMPLAEVAQWTRGPYSIEHRLGRYFRVVAVAVEAGNREVTGWTQPLFEPRGTGVTAFLARRIGGVPHVLVNARVEGGFLDTVELGPTVQCVPENHPGPGRPGRPPFLDAVLDADPSHIHYEALHSEEGGRFLNAVSRYLIIDADADSDDADPAQAPLDAPPGFQWVTPGQLTALARHGHYLNVQARTLLAALTTGAVRW